MAGDSAGETVESSGVPSFSERPAIFILDRAPRIFILDRAPRIFILDRAATDAVVNDRPIAAIIIPPRRFIVLAVPAAIAFRAFRGLFIGVTVIGTIHRIGEGYGAVWVG